jgi:hypothetical protein
VGFLTEVVAENRLSDFQLFRKLQAAEDFYFRGFAAVVQQLPVQLAHGGFIRLTGCFLYEVRTLDLAAAKRIVRLNEARRLQSTDDFMCGVPVAIDLFRVLN